MKKLKLVFLGVCMSLVLGGNMAHASDAINESLTSKIKNFVKEASTKVRSKFTGVNIQAACQLAGLIEYKPASLGYCLAFRNRNQALLAKLPAVASKIGTQTFEKLSKTMPEAVSQDLNQLKQEYSHLIPTVKPAHENVSVAQRELVEKLLIVANYETVKSLIKTGLFFASLQYQNLLEAYGVTLDPEKAADIVHETTIEVLATSLTAHEINELIEFFQHETFNLIIKNRGIAIDMLIKEMPELAPLKMLAGA
ncbi:hypothetical protein K2W90_05995 [Candidatus Babeliales bacterium]|nr:hypothetical protein [Candidatus Babeliales bacterium]